jgi:hypothetical protein
LSGLKTQAQTIDAGAGQYPAERQIPAGFSGIPELLSPSQPSPRAQDQMVGSLLTRQPKKGRRGGPVVQLAGIRLEPAGQRFMSRIAHRFRASGRMDMDHAHPGLQIFGQSRARRQDIHGSFLIAGQEYQDLHGAQIA